MLLNVAMTVTLIAACFGHEPLYDERESNEAISTHSFNRDDIPISYKYTAIHVYSTEKPNGDNIIRRQKYQTPGYHAIQYAPLHNKEIERTVNNSTRDIKLVLDPINIVKKGNTATRLDNLEPRKYRIDPARINGFTTLNYFVPGHNIEIIRSPKLSRNPGHNAVYRSHPENIKGTQIKVNHLSDYMKHQVSSAGNEDKIFLSDSDNPSQEPFAWLRQNHKPDTYTFYKGETLISPNKFNQAPTHHTHHRMQINVARSNRHAQVIAKGIVIGDISNNLGTLQSHTNLKGSVPLNAEHNTLLYPLKNRHLFQNVS